MELLLIAVRSEFKPSVVPIDNQLGVPVIIIGNNHPAVDW